MRWDMKFATVSHTINILNITYNIQCLCHQIMQLCHYRQQNPKKVKISFPLDIVFFNI